MGDYQWSVVPTQSTVASPRVSTQLMMAAIIAQMTRRSVGLCSVRTRAGKEDSRRFHNHREGLNVKAPVVAFNQEKDLSAFSLIVKSWGTFLM